MHSKCREPARGEESGSKLPHSKPSRARWLAQTHFSRSAALLTDRAQAPRAYKTGPR